MGAAAFLMAEYMGIPYIQVATIAIIPAILYFGGIFFTVHLEAKSRGLKGIPWNELPTWIYLLKNCYLIIPLVVLVWIVSAGIYTMAVSAAISIFVAFVIGFIHFFLTNWAEKPTKPPSPLSSSTPSRPLSSPQPTLSRPAPATPSPSPSPARSPASSLAASPSPAWPRRSSTSSSSRPATC